MPLRLLIDTDPGIDDTLALLMALHSPELEVLGLTTIFGNGGTETTAQNARRVVEIAGRAEIPVAAGATQPLARPLREIDTAVVHGHDGLGDAHLPPPRYPPIAQEAAQFIVEQVRANPGEITLVAVGPLTNLALALRLEPALPQLVRAVVIMGGAALTHGNITPVAEANIHGDPEAADMVLAAGWPLTMVGLDVTTKTRMSPQFIEALGSGSTPSAELLRKIFPRYQEFHDKYLGMGGSTHTHDPSAIGYLLEPGLFATEQWPLHVITEGRCVGQTVADPYRIWGERPAHTVCMGVDSPRLLELIRARATGEG